MKLTKSKLQQIIKEELGGGLERAIREMNDLHDEWKPTSDEGRKYKSDLNNLIMKVSLIQITG
jgi:hypothetical protein